jgi:hypothetical protein
MPMEKRIGTQSPNFNNIELLQRLPRWLSKLYGKSALRIQMPLVRSPRGGQRTSHAIELGHALARETTSTRGSLGNAPAFFHSRPDKYDQTDSTIGCR